MRRRAGRACPPEPDPPQPSPSSRRPPHNPPTSGRPAGSTTTPRAAAGSAARRPAALGGGAVEQLVHMRARACRPLPLPSRRTRCAHAPSLRSPLTSAALPLMLSGSNDAAMWLGRVSMTCALNRGRGVTRGGRTGRWAAGEVRSGQSGQRAPMQPPAATRPPPTAHLHAHGHHVPLQHQIGVLHALPGGGRVGGCRRCACEAAGSVCLGLANAGVCEAAGYRAGASARPGSSTPCHG